MISNAIPGIANVNTLVNNAPAKGIAVSSDVKDAFRKALAQANTENKAASVTTSLNKTLNQTVTKADNQRTPDLTDATTERMDAASKGGDATKNGKAKVSDEKDNTQVTENNAVTSTAENGNVAEQTQETEAEEGVIVISEEAEGNAEITANSDALNTALIDEAMQLLQNLADELSLDIEDIQNAMETLGLTNIAILNPANMSQLIGQLTAGDDAMAVVTNADIYLNVQNMQDAVYTARQDLMEEFDLTEEQLSAALEEFAENLPKEEAQGEPVVNTFNETLVEAQIEQAPVMVQQPVKLEVTEEEGIVREISDNTAFVQPEVAEEVIELPEEFGRNNDGGNKRNSDEKGQNTPMFNHFFNQISSSLSEVSEAAAQTQQAPMADTQKIMDQITEFIKVNIKAESTSMELQLHPASLGTVNVMIEQAKDGNMIAKFMTQNEDVRAAIESQLQQLQEKFNEQGIKVTAVEVTVNAGGFDQTLNDSQSQKEEDQENQNIIRKPMRRIRLGDITPEGIEGLEQVDETDRLTAEMMAINGNSVDFSA
ncbi:flagellar hook-length control protein FliK [Butyrivibrio sp. MB2005]|uniref:flagellar hook-length control protein FliK n=1 Tax=Butyrivibrio sp. MB2005 TaxID=1280678 RepID=UPI0004294A08|nr:flagellar hook-length control protein FliK [Butyrivibrio sp. MB2005]